MQPQNLPLPLRTEFLMQLSGELEAPQEIGAAPPGPQRIYYVKGGAFAGPGLSGSVLPGGGDWMTMRKDGIAQLDVRITLRTDDGAPIFVSYRGKVNMSTETRQRIADGEAVDPSEYYFRVAPFFETRSEKYAWMNGVIAVGIGRRTATGVGYSIHVVR